MTALGDFSAGDVLTAADLNAIGIWTSYNATVSQGGSSVSLSTNAGYYIQINELVIARFFLSANATGSANDLIVSLPVNTGSNSSVMMGPASVFDASVGSQTIGTWFRNSASTIDMSVEPSGRYDTALGSGDVIRGVIMYEVA